MITSDDKALVLQAPFDAGLKPYSADDLAATRILSYIQSARTPATRRARLLDLRDVVRLLELPSPAALFELTPESVMQYRDHLVSLGQAVSTIARKISSLRGLFGYSLARGWVQVNPALPSLVPLPSVPKESLTEWLTKEEARLLLATCDLSTLEGLRDQAIILLLFHHGLRREELVSLAPSKPATWQASSVGGYFTSERHYKILVIKGKGGKIRKHPVKPQVLTSTEDYLFATGRNLESLGVLFWPLQNNRTGILEKALTPEGVACMIRRRCKKAGIAKNITPHSLRHSSATFALDAGSSVRKVADFLGHADVRTTMRYDRQRQNLDDSAAHAITL